MSKPILPRKMPMTPPSAPLSHHEEPQKPEPPHHLSVVRYVYRPAWLEKKQGQSTKLHGIAQAVAQTLVLRTTTCMLSEIDILSQRLAMPGQLPASSAVPSTSTSRSPSKPQPSRSNSPSMSILLVRDASVVYHGFQRPSEPQGPSPLRSPILYHIFSAIR